jgi:hypothetical protein
VLTEYDKNVQQEAREKQANTEAISRYPELLNTNSDYYREVNKELASNGTGAPGEILAVANEVAIRMGITPAAQGPRQRIAQHVAPGRGGGKPAPRTGSEDALPDEAYAAIAQRLGSAMRKGKMTKEHEESIKSKANELQDIIDTHGHEALRG